MDLPKTPPAIPHRNPRQNYFIFGPDSCLVDEAKSRVTREICERVREEIPPSKFDLDESSIEDLLNLARNLPMFTRRQIIQVKGVMRLREGQSRKLKEYLEDPSPFSYLVFLGGELSRDDRRRKIFEILESGLRVIEVAGLQGPRLRERLELRIRNAACTIDRAAVDFLLDLHGNDLSRLNSEIDKILLFSNGPAHITLEMISALAGFSREHTLFEFVDALAVKDTVKALRLAGEFIADTSQALPMIALMARTLRQFLQIKELAGKATSSEIGKQVGFYGMPPSLVEKKIDQAKRFSYPALAHALQRLGKLDDRIKSSSIDTGLFMELLVHDLTR